MRVTIRAFLQQSRASDPRRPALSVAAAMVAASERLVPQLQEAVMKVLVATSATQGKRSTDTAGCIEGEIVWAPTPCAASRRDPFGECACGRSFSGLETDGASTTAMVEEIIGYSRDDHVAAIHAMGSHGVNCECLDWIEPLVDHMMEQVERLPIGAVVERHLRRINVRLVATRQRG